MQIEQTSLESFKDIQLKIGSRHKEIIGVLKNSSESLTDTEIARVLGKLDPNYVRPRRRELSLMGAIHKSDKRKCSITKKNCLTWRIDSSIGKVGTGEYIGKADIFSTDDKHKGSKPIILKNISCGTQISCGTHGGREEIEGLLLFK